MNILSAGILAAIIAITAAPVMAAPLAATSELVSGQSLSGATQVRGEGRHWNRGRHLSWTKRHYGRDRAHARHHGFGRRS